MRNKKNKSSRFSLSAPAAGGAQGNLLPKRGFALFFCLFSLGHPIPSWAGDSPRGVAIADFTDRLIVKMKAGPGGIRTMGASQAERLSQLAGVQLSPARTMSGSAQVVRLPRHVTLAEAEEIARQLAANPEVGYAVPDRILHPARAPNDPRYGEQWHYQAPIQAAGGANLAGAWDVTTGSANVVIGVLDSGILPHADLTGRVLPGYDFVSDPFRANDGDGRDPDPTDPGDWVTAADALIPGCPTARNSSWHGTHVAGTIGAASDNGVGVAGVSWTSRILPVRVLGKCGGYTSDLIDGMRWAAGLPVPGVPLNPYPAKVLNLSLGSRAPCDAAFQEAINEIVARGTAIVAAAGNDSADAANVSPANCSNVIAVAALDQYGARAYYSNYGTSVKIAAPGGAWESSGILSTSDSGLTVPIRDNTYKRLVGTSMATAHVTGVAGLLFSVNPSLTPAQLLQLLQTTARPFPTSLFFGCTTSTCGAGILDGTAAVYAAAQALGLASSVDVRNYVPAANGAVGYTSYIRVINTGARPTPVNLTLLDETGRLDAGGQLAASLPADGAQTFSAAQVEAALGANLSAWTRPRLRVSAPASTVEVQSFMSNPGGVVADMSNARKGSSVDVSSYVPAANGAAGYTSYIRVVNRGSTATPVTVTLLDGATGTAGVSGWLTSSLAPGAAATFSAAQVEAALGTSIPAGDRPRIRVSGLATTLDVMSFMSNPGGAVSEMSGAQSGQTVDVRSYVPAANGAWGYNSYLRVVNTGTVATPITVALLDGMTGAVGASGQLTPSLPVGGAMTFGAAQVEAALGRAIPAADRPRIRVAGLGGSSLQVMSFMSNPGGVVTEMSSAQTGATVDVRSYVPAANSIYGYMSYLRVVNSGAVATPVTVTLLDGATGTAAATGQLTPSLAAGAAMTYSAAQVEAALGLALPAADRPRIRVNSPVSTLEVVSFMNNPGGVVTDISSAQSPSE